MIKQKKQITSFTQYIPLAFVLLWATGFIGAKYAMPYAEPFSFLSIRFAVTLFLLGFVIIFIKVNWPSGISFYLALLSGVLIHTIYLGAVFLAIKNGLPAGYAGILVGLQPMITAFFATNIIGDKITRAQIIGLIIGLIGVFLVLFPNETNSLDINSLVNALIVLGGVIAFSLGAVLQKKYNSNQTLVGTIWLQYFGALLVSLPIALIFESFHFDWNGELIFAFVWLILVLSIGAILLLMMMIKAGEATKVASYFYLVPVVTVIIAYFLFGEVLNLLQIFGMILTSLGVMLATIFSNGIRKAN